MRKLQKCCQLSYKTNVPYFMAPDVLCVVLHDQLCFVILLFRFALKLYACQRRVLGMVNTTQNQFLFTGPTSVLPSLSYLFMLVYS